jgi:hypothetical protein
MRKKEVKLSKPLEKFPNDYIPTQTPVRSCALDAFIENEDFRARMITSSSDLRYQ